MTDNPFESDCPPETIERGLEALAEGWRRRFPGAEVVILPARPKPNPSPNDENVSFEAAPWTQS
jgi:hypothetical protein